MVERHDANGDGQIDLEEMTARDQGDRLDRLFDHVDGNGDGVITQAEAEQARGGWAMGRWGRGHGRGHR